MLGQIIRDIFSASKNRASDRQGTAPKAPAYPGFDDNPLAEYFFNHTGPVVHKWRNYLEIYHRHLQRFRNKAPVIVEIGVAQGGSLPMWHHYFGQGTKVVGVDIDPACRRFEGGATTVLIGDQADRGFLATLRERVPRIDILIDDGGHTMEQQIATFEEIYPHIQPDGIYVCEDMHTSLWPHFGGGYRRPGTFLEYTKGLVDKLFSWHSLDIAAFTVDDFTLSTHSIHFYDSVVVVEKRRMEPPEQIESSATTIKTLRNLPPPPP